MRQKGSSNATWVPRKQSEAQSWGVGRAGVQQETLSPSLPHTAGLRSLRTAESLVLPEL